MNLDFKLLESKVAEYLSKSYSKQTLANKRYEVKKYLGNLSVEYIALGIVSDIQNK